MAPAYAIYMLQVLWVNDHSNREFATLTIEGREGLRYEKGFESLLDPDCSPSEKDAMMRELGEVAHALRRQHGGYHLAGSRAAKMVCLYRVVDVTEQPTPLGNPKALVSDVRFVLTPICQFDEDGNPIPVGSSL